MHRNFLWPFFFNFSARTFPFRHCAIHLCIVYGLVCFVLWFCFVLFVLCFVLFCFCVLFCFVLFCFVFCFVLFCFVLFYLFCFVFCFALLCFLLCFFMLSCFVFCFSFVVYLFLFCFAFYFYVLFLCFVLFSNISLHKLGVLKFNGIIHPKMKFLSSLTLMLSQTFVILSSVENKRRNFEIVFVHSIIGNGVQIIGNIISKYLYLQKTLNHTSLEWHDGE